MTERFNQQKNKVVFINAPNTNDFLMSKESGVTKGEEHTDWANFPHLGILSLASMVDEVPHLEGVYFDCVVCPPDHVWGFLESHTSEVLAVCFSLLTANYIASISMMKSVKIICPEAKIIVGNDHFSSMPEVVLSENKGLIDCGFLGNEILGSLKVALLEYQEHGRVLQADLPGFVGWGGQGLKKVSQAPEELFTSVNYKLIDRWFDHSSLYSYNFQSRIGARLAELFGREVNNGVPVEFARGCIKFASNDACSFCSIQFGGMWRNSVNDSNQAWEVIKNATDAGYDYLYVTADELPLTFVSLINAMHKNRPSWWRDLPLNERPILTGYARADGLHRHDLLNKMYEIGFRILYVGIDAGAPASLAAMNKPLKDGGSIEEGESLFRANMEALIKAGESGMKIKAGLVMGHLGMNQSLLEANMSSYKDLIKQGCESIVSVDVEVLSPEPGSLDFQYLTLPTKAFAAAEKLGLEISNEEIRNEIASNYFNVECFDRNEAIKDYIRAVMPELSLELLQQARDEIRLFAKQHGAVVGDQL